MEQALGEKTISKADTTKSPRTNDYAGGKLAENRRQLDKRG